MTKRRIIYVWNYREWGGAQIYFFSLMKEARATYDVSALIPSDSAQRIIDYLEAWDVPYDFLGKAPSMVPATTVTGKIRRRIQLLASENALVRYLERNVDLCSSIVHVDLGFWQSLLPLLRLSRKGHVVMTMHTALPIVGPVRRLIWQAKGSIIGREPRFHLVASNRDAKDGLKPYLAPASLEQVTVGYSGFDPHEIDRVRQNHPGREAVLQRYSVPADKRVVLTVGQFIPRKGCWTLLEALRNMSRSRDDFIFLWLGTAALDSETIRRIESFGLGDRFRFLSAAEIGDTRDDLLNLVNGADIFVLASFEEGLPIALVEAMALGRACVATSVNAIPEAIENGANGVLVPPGDANALAKAIGELLNDEPRRIGFGEAAAKTAREKFDASHTARQIVKLYDRVWKTSP